MFLLVLLVTLYTFVFLLVLLVTLYTCVRNTSEGKNMLFCSAVLASVARYATQVFVPGCICFVLELAPRKSIAGNELVAYHAFEFVLLLLVTLYTSVRNTFGRKNMLFCCAVLESVARCATPMFLLGSISFVL